MKEEIYSANFNLKPVIQYLSFILLLSGSTSLSSERTRFFPSLLHSVTSLLPVHTNLSEYAALLKNLHFSLKNVVLQVTSVSCFLTRGLKVKICNFWSCSALKPPQKAPLKAQTSWWLLHIFKAGLNILLEIQAFGRRDIFQTALSGNEVSHCATSVTCCWLELGGRQGNTNTWKRKPNQHLTEQGHREPG